MKEHEMESYLIEVIDWASNEDGMVVGVDTFESAGLLTNSQGLVLKMKDGSQFQLKITKSK
jgi:hypothetical protein